MSRPASPASSRPASLYSSGGDNDTRPRSSSAGPVHSEICVLLKPPPSAHSFLNLQIQLVNSNRQQQQSHSQSDLSRPSSESSFAQVAQASTPHQQQHPVSSSSASSPTDENGPSGSSSSEGFKLTRTNSGRSNRSSSGSSFFSTASRRATTPLYNFEFHRVLPTVITDAGTEAKIARVLKRGIDVHELAQIEAVEMVLDAEGRHQRPFPSVTTQEPLSRVTSPAGTTATSDSLQEPSKATPEHPGSSQPESEAAAPNANEANEAPQTTSQNNSMMSRFKRMSFRPKEAMGFKPSAASTFRLPSFASGLKAPTFSSSKPPSAAPSSGAPASGDLAANAESAGAAPAQVQSLGMFKAEAPSGLDETPVGKHAPGYLWTVKKFLRPDLEGKEGLIDLTIEWKKRRKGAASTAANNRLGSGSRSKSRSNTVRSSRPTTPSASPGQTHLMLPEDNADRRHSVDLSRPTKSAVSEAKAHRISLQEQPKPASETSAAAKQPHNTPHVVQARRIAQQEDNASPRSSMASVDEKAEADDSGNESDPEDSESPWVCELVLSTPILTPPGSTTLADDSASAQQASRSNTRRIRLGTFLPAPHHPRVVGQLSIPLSLRRVHLGLPSDPTAEGSGTESISAEEMKDFLCITLLWLCIRESLGGVTSRRKSEAWRNL